VKLAPPADLRREQTEINMGGMTPCQARAAICVGDGRQGSYQNTAELSSDERFSGEVKFNRPGGNIRGVGGS